MKKLKITAVTISLFLTIFVFSGSALAELNIVTTVPDLASIAKDIGGDNVNVKSLGKGYQNPHYVDAKPSYIVDLNKADLLISIGLDLEIGWLSILVTGARNSKINSPNFDGNLNTSTLVPLMDVYQTKVDRSQGDIHPEGNPHFLLDPRRAIIVANGIAERLTEIDPENALSYETNLAGFASKLEAKIIEWDKSLAPYKGTKIFTYHKLWTYFIDWADFEEKGTIEPKPGIPPSPRHVADLIKIAESSDVKLVLSANYYPKKTGEQIASTAGIPFLSLPVQVGGENGIDSYTSLIDNIVNSITSTLKKDLMAINE